MVSAEEAPKRMLESNLKLINEKHINTPTILYKVGDRVQRGAIKQSIVTDVLEGGKILKLHEIVTDNNYGRPIDYERDDYVAWHDVAPYVEADKQPKVIYHEDDVLIQYCQMSVMSIFTYYYGFGIDLEPDYQRGLVWDLDDKQKLIDSIFNNVDIGKFVLIKLPYAPGRASNECLDGKQRITALIEFYEGRFAYKGLTYHQMNYRDQSHFEDYPVAIAHVRPMTDAQKSRYFLKLNTCGKPIDQEQLKRVKKMYEEATK